MRFDSSSSFHCVAAAAAEATISSFRASFRGGRGAWRRGFSERSSDNREPLVSEDSHFRPVRDANYGFRQGRGGGFRNLGGFPPQNSRPRLPFGQPTPPHPRRPKPLDFRNWEYALKQPPSHCERFVVLSYNILADYLAMNHRRELYFHIPRHILDWQWRMRNIIFEVGLWSADIMCFQEVDRFQDLEEALKLEGYDGIWKMRTGNAVDGCATFWRNSRFKLLHEEYIEFNKFGLRDNVAQICVLESNSSNAVENRTADFSSSPCANQVVVCNIHVLYNPKRGEIKLGQVRLLLERAYAVSRIWNDAPVVICGDFNCTPKSPLYNYISEQKLSLSGLARDQVSGQHSAEIAAPKPFNPNSGVGLNGVPSASNPLAASTLGDGTQVGIKQSSCFSDVNKQNKSYSDVENAPSDVQRGNGNNISAAAEKATQQDTVKGCKDEFGPAVHGLNDFLEGSPSINHWEGGLAVDLGDDKSHEFCVTTEEKSNPSAPYGSAYEVKISNETTDFDVSLDQKLADLSIDKVDEAAGKNENVGEDNSSFSPDKFNGEGISSVEVDCNTFVGPSSVEKDQFSDKCITIQNKSTLNPQSVEIQDDSPLDMETKPPMVENYAYNSYLWTPVEIEAASGIADCTLLEHPLKLKSTYAKVEDYYGTRDSSREPEVTSYNRRFLGTVDYIWCSEGLQTVKVLDTIPKHVLQQTPGFPTRKWGSDHIALACQLAFEKDAHQS